jgi:hypothetical protein
MAFPEYQNRFVIEVLCNTLYGCQSSPAFFGYYCL